MSNKNSWLIHKEEGVLFVDHLVDPPRRPSRKKASNCGCQPGRKIVLHKLLQQKPPGSSRSDAAFAPHRFSGVLGQRGRAKRRGGPPKSAHHRFTVGNWVAGNRFIIRRTALLLGNEMHPRAPRQDRRWTCERGRTPETRTRAPKGESHGMGEARPRVLAGEEPA